MWRTSRRMGIAAPTAALTCALTAALALTVLAATRARGQPAGCTPTYSKTASPSAVLLGETVTVTLHAAATCTPPEWDNLNLVLVLDASPSLDGGSAVAQADAFVWLVEHLDLVHHPGRQVGVVGYGGSARVACELSNLENQVVSCIRSLHSIPPTLAIDRGVIEGTKVLVLGRHGPEPDVLQVMIVTAHAPSYSGCGRVLQAAGQAKGQGIELITLALGPDADAACLRQAATAPEYFVEVPSRTGLPAAMRLVLDMLHPAARRITLIDTVPPNMRLVPGSDQPPGLWDGATRVLLWQFAFPPVNGVTATLRLQPLEVGRHDTNVSATGELIDRNDSDRAWTFPVPRVNVLSPGGLASPTSGPPHPTATATASPTATPQSHVRYIPRAFAERDRP